MFGRVWSCIVSGNYATIPATLHGYQRLAVTGEEYPVAVPAPSEISIPGILYLNVNTADIARLHAFEGDYYLRLQTPLLTVTGDTLIAQTYVLNPIYQHIAAPFEWDVEQFRNQGLERFITRYPGFH